MPLGTDEKLVGMLDGVGREQPDHVGRLDPQIAVEPDEGLGARKQARQERTANLREVIAADRRDAFKSRQLGWRNDGDMVLAQPGNGLGLASDIDKCDADTVPIHLLFHQRQNQSLGERKVFLIARKDDKRRQGTFSPVRFAD